MLPELRGETDDGWLQEKGRVSEAETLGRKTLGEMPHIRGIDKNTHNAHTFQLCPAPSGG